VTKKTMRKNRKYKDFVGGTYGKSTMLRILPTKTGESHTRAEFYCNECEKTFVSRIDRYISNSPPKTCRAHSQTKYEDFIGEKIKGTRLTLLEFYPVKNGQRKALFRCECGETCIRNLYYVFNPHGESAETISCGCLSWIDRSQLEGYEEWPGESKEQAYARWRSRNRRKEIIELLGSQCAECGITDERVLHVEHIIPRSQIGGAKKTTNVLWKDIKDGREDLINLQLLCANCHEIKSRKEAENQAKERNAQRSRNT